MFANAIATLFDPFQSGVQHRYLLVRGYSQPLKHFVVLDVDSLLAEVFRHLVAKLGVDILHPVSQRGKTLQDQSLEMLGIDHDRLVPIPRTR